MSNTKVLDRILKVLTFFPVHFSLQQTELLIQKQLTRESSVLSPTLQRDFRHVLEFAPRLLEDLIKVLYSLYFFCIK